MTLFREDHPATLPPKLVTEGSNQFLRRALSHLVEADGDDSARAMPHSIILSSRRDGPQGQQVKAILNGRDSESPARRQVSFVATTIAQPPRSDGAKLNDFTGFSTTKACHQTGKILAKSRACSQSD